MKTDVAFVLRAGSALLVIVLLMSLGFWQLDRAKQKRALYGVFERNANAPAVEVDSLPALSEVLPDFAWRPIHAAGGFANTILLLDNRVKAGQAGYDVLVPFITTRGLHILVDLGWVNAPPLRASLPTVAVPQGVGEIRGRIAPPPAMGITLGQTLDPEKLAPTLWRIQRIDFSQLGSMLQMPLAPSIVYLDTDQAQAYDRSWTLPTVGDGKHIAYAVQWFAMAFAVAVIASVYLRRPSAKSKASAQ